MSEVVLKSISRFSEIITQLRQQVNDINQIKQLIDTHLDAFIKALDRMNDSLEMIMYVFKGSNEHNELFNHKLLNFSQIDIIVIKLDPLPKLLRLLSELKYKTKFVERMRLYWELYTNYDRPSLIRAQLKRHFNVIEKALPVIIELNRTMFGSAMRIKQPVLRKAWMLAGESQLNDSSLPINIIQDNLYMLLKMEIGEKMIKKMRKKNYKKLIKQIVADIDNRGASIGDGNISLAELNDLPDDVMMNIHSEGYDNEYSDDICDVNYPLKLKPSVSSSQKIQMLEDTCNWICSCLYTSYPTKVVTDDVPLDNVDKTPSLYITHVKDKQYIIRVNDFINRYRDYFQNERKKNGNKTNVAKLKSVETILALSPKSDDTKDTDNHDDILDGADEIFSEIPPIDGHVKLEKILHIDDKTRRNEHPKSIEDYGYNFLSIKVASLKITRPSEISDKLNDTTSILTTVTFTVTASDQGWGGSNNAHVRYQINDDGNCVKAFTITRRPKDNIQGEYTFDINGYELNTNSDENMEQTIYIWLYCPPWSGWKATIHDIKCKLSYN